MMTNATLVAESTLQDTRSPPIRRVLLPAVLFALFFLSGAAAIVYEVAWTRRLTLLFSASTLAVSAVLSAFMLGLASGAALLGRLGDRVRRPLLLYGILELLVGAYALVFPALTRAIEGVVIRAEASLADRLLPLLLLRLFSAYLLLLPPTLLMGGTLPVLARVIGRSLIGFRAQLSRLYAANLWGATSGALLSGFLLMPLLGVTGTIHAAAAANVIVGLVSLLLGFRLQTAPSLPEPEALAGDAPEAAEGPSRTSTMRLGVVLFASGFAGLALQVLWTRILVFFLANSVYAFALMLATVLAGLAIGASLVTSEKTAPAKRLGKLLLAAGLLTLLLSALPALLVPILAPHVWWMQGTNLGYGIWSLAIAALLIGPPAMFLGGCFPLASRLFVRRACDASRSLGVASAINTVGCVTGSIAAGFVMIPLLGIHWSVLVLGVALTGLGLAVLPRGAVRPVLLVGSGALAVVGGVLLAMAAAQPEPLKGMVEWESVQARSDYKVLDHKEGVTASLAVLEAKNGAGRLLQVDGFMTASTRITARYMKLMAHLPLLRAPATARKVLVICFGTGTTAGTTTLYPLERTDVVDINRDVFSFADYFAAENHSVATSQRARLIVNDGRHFLRTTAETYDIITLEPMPPSFAGMAHLYSKEFYEEASARLGPEGILCQWLPLHLVPESDARSITAAMLAVFPEVELWLDFSTGILVASKKSPFPLNVDDMQARASRAAVRDDLARSRIAAVELPYFWGLGTPELRAFASGATVVTDDFPVVEFIEPRYQMSGVPMSEMGALLAHLYELRVTARSPYEGVPATRRQRFDQEQKAISYQRLMQWAFLAGQREQARQALEKAKSERLADDLWQSLNAGWNALSRGEKLPSAD
jgi:spermidine synthase